MSATKDTIAPLRDFVVAMTMQVDREKREDRLLAEARPCVCPGSTTPKRKPCA